MRAITRCTRSRALPTSAAVALGLGLRCILFGSFMAASSFQDSDRFAWSSSSSSSSASLNRLSSTRSRGMSLAEMGMPTLCRIALRRCSTSLRYRSIMAATDRRARFRRPSTSSVDRRAFFAAAVDTAACSKVFSSCACMEPCARVALAAGLLGWRLPPSITVRSSSRFIRLVSRLCSTGLSSLSRLLLRDSRFIFLFSSTRYMDAARSPLTFLLNTPVLLSSLALACRRLSAPSCVSVIFATSSLSSSLSWSKASAAEGVLDCVANTRSRNESFFSFVSFAVSLCTLFAFCFWLASLCF
mmetsp:Transcript_33161/g.63664  ORF Transcript_33161/g.63664 Transcript_33161/m.63664 type:complete len:300 (-) Transcript_33161:229-1128(-)